MANSQTVPFDLRDVFRQAYMAEDSLIQIASNHKCYGCIESQCPLLLGEVVSQHQYPVALFRSRQ